MAVYSPCPLYDSAELDYAIFIGVMAEKGLKVRGLSSVEIWILQSCLARHDWEHAETLLKDWQIHTYSV